MSYQFNEWWEKHSDTIFSASKAGHDIYDWFEKCWEKSRQELWHSIDDMTPKELEKGVRTAREDQAIEEKDEAYFKAEQEELEFREHMRKKMHERMRRESEAT